MRPFRFIFALFVVLALCLAALAASSSADAPHVHVQLVAPQDQIYPGGSNVIGLYFKLEPGWHVYWQNAGDSGEPPHIHWTLPDGITAGPLQFPAPTRLPLGPLMDFGYEDQVLFPIQLQVAEKVKDSPAVLDAKVDWLVCREVCIPGKTDLALPLPVAAQRGPVDPARQALFDRFRARLPQPLPSSAKAVYGATPGGFALALTGHPATNAELHGRILCGMEPNTLYI